MFQVGAIVNSHGVLWEIESFTTDTEGFLVVTMIEADFDQATFSQVKDGVQPASIKTRDIISLRPVDRVLAA